MSIQMIGHSLYVSDTLPAETPPTPTFPVTVKVTTKGLKIYKSPNTTEAVGDVFKDKHFTVLEISPEPNGNIWGRLAEGIYLPLYLNGSYKTDWRP